MQGLFSFVLVDGVLQTLTICRGSCCCFSIGGIFKANYFYFFFDHFFPKTNVKNVHGW